jgi:predicted nucleic acid-binding Zn ribbon protein
MSRFEEIRQLQATWERVQGRRARRVFVPVGTCTIPSNERAVFVPSPDVRGAVGSMPGLDWYEDEALTGDQVRFE